MVVRALPFHRTGGLEYHTWDLATATGQQPDWDDAVVGVSLALMERVLPAAEARRKAYDEAASRLPADRGPFKPPFADAVPVPAHARPIDRLVAWTGRRP